MKIKTYSLSTYFTNDNRSNIVALYYEIDLLKSELNTLRRESPGFENLPNNEIIYKESEDFQYGWNWSDDFAVVNITVHEIEIQLSANVSNIFNDL